MNKLRKVYVMKTVRKKNKIDFNGFASFSIDGHHADFYRSEALQSVHATCEIGDSWMQ